MSPEPLPRHPTPSYFHRWSCRKLTKKIDFHAGLHWRTIKQIGQHLHFGLSVSLKWILSQLICEMSRHIREIAVMTWKPLMVASASVGQIIFWLCISYSVSLLRKQAWQKGADTLCVCIIRVCMHRCCVLCCSISYSISPGNDELVWPLTTPNEEMTVLCWLNDLAGLTERKTEFKKAAHKNWNVRTYNILWQIVFLLFKKS